MTLKPSAARYPNKPWEGEPGPDTQLPKNPGYFRIWLVNKIMPKIFWTAEQIKQDAESQRQREMSAIEQKVAEMISDLVVDPVLRRMLAKTILETKPTKMDKMTWGIRKKVRQVRPPVEFSVSGAAPTMPTVETAPTVEVQRREWVKPAFVYLLSFLSYVVVLSTGNMEIIRTSTMLWIVIFYLKVLRGIEEAE